MAETYYYYCGCRLFVISPLYHFLPNAYATTTRITRRHWGIASFSCLSRCEKYSKRGIMWFDWILGILVLITAGYLCYEYDALMTTRGGIPNENDIIFRRITTLIVIEAARRLTGYILIIFRYCSCSIHLSVQWILCRIGY